MSSKCWELAGELERERRKNELKLAAICEIARAEKAGPESLVTEHSFGKALGNGALSATSVPVQPVNAESAIIICPVFDEFENLDTRALQAISVMLR